MRSPLASSRRTWLGVCLSLARKTGIAVRWIRLGFVAAGVVTGPLALLVYLGIYADLYASDKDRGAPNVDRRQLLTAIGGSAAAVLTLYAASLVLHFALAWGFVRLTGEAFLLGPLGWMQVWQHFLVVAALLICLPFSALSGLPVPHAWAGTLRKVAMALVGIYAVILCFGLASTLVAILLRLVDSVAI